MKETRLSGARGPGSRERAGKGTTARMAKAAGVPALAVPTPAVLARAIGLVALLACFALPAAASAQGGGTGGAQPQASPTPTATPAPAAPALPPARSRIRLTRLACASGCGAGGAVRPGALLRVRGTGMRRTAEVHFDGAQGDADDVAAAPVKRRKTSVDVRVPLGAATGSVTVLDRDGVLTKPAPAALTVEQPAAATPAAGGPSIDVDAQAPKAFFDAMRPMRMSYVVHDDRPVNVRVELVRVADQAVVASWAPGVVAARDAAGRAVERHGRGPRAEGRPLRVPRELRRRGGRAARLERPGAGRAAARGRRARPGLLHLPAPHLPDPRPARLRRVRRRSSAAGAATRARTSSPPAARRWWRPAAAS